MVISDKNFAQDFPYHTSMYSIWYMYIRPFYLWVGVGIQIGIQIQITDRVDWTQ